MEQISLEARDFDKIQSYGMVRHYNPGDVVFSEGEPADFVYFIESGDISIFLYEFTNRVEVGQRGGGEFFGEMAVVNKGKRNASASATTESKLIAVDKAHFLELLGADDQVSAKISSIIGQRTEELILKENLLATTGVKGNHLQISIKGDPSLRESAFARERHESPVDKVLPELIQKLKVLLLERCVSEVFLQFNSGEIRLTSIFDPFNYEIHPANKLIDSHYLDRHFPVLAYAEKTRLIHRMYETIATEFSGMSLPPHYKTTYQNHYRNWQPLAQEEIVKVIDKLPLLRNIPDFYLRNLGISITRDAIRMQFNCDGTHIISIKDYDRFLADNVEMQDTV